MLGQTWYNSKTKKLNIYNDGWEELVMIPNTDDLEIIYNTRTSENVHGKLVLSEELAKYIPLSGNNKHVPIKSSKLEFVDPNEAVTKKYVNDTLTSGAIKYLPKNGTSETMTGPLKIVDVNSTDSSYIAANVGYVKDIGKLTTITNNTKNIPLSNSRLFSFRITKHSVKNKKDDNGQLVFDDEFTTVFFKAKLGTTDATKSSIDIELPFAFKQIGSRYIMTIVANSIGENKRLSINIITGSKFSISKLDDVMSPLEVHGSIFGFAASDTDISTNEFAINADNINHVKYSTDNNINALLGNVNAQWNFLKPTRDTLYYTFDINVLQDPNDLQPNYFTGPFVACNESQKSAIRKIFTYITTIIGVKFKEEFNGNLGDIHFYGADITNPSPIGVCISSPPIFKTDANNELTSYIGDTYLYLDNNEGVEWGMFDPKPGTFGYQAILHEIGHALGLKHPHEGTYKLSTETDNTSNTIMSYVNSQAGPNDYHTEFKPYDVKALQWIYGTDGLGGKGNY
jgi:hypothetical protein